MAGDVPVMVVDAEVLWREQHPARDMADLISLFCSGQSDFETLHTLILDLSSIDVLTSKELGQLVRLNKNVVSADKRLILVVPSCNRGVIELFDVTGLAEIFPIYDDTGSALEHV